MHTLEYLNALFAVRLEHAAGQEIADDFRLLTNFALSYDPANETEEIRRVYEEWFEKYDGIMHGGSLKPGLHR